MFPHVDLSIVQDMYAAFDGDETAICDYLLREFPAPANLPQPSSFTLASTSSSQPLLDQSKPRSTSPPTRSRATGPAAGGSTSTEGRENDDEAVSRLTFDQCEGDRKDSSITDGNIVDRGSGESEGDLYQDADHTASMDTVRGIRDGTSSQKSSPSTSNRRRSIGEGKVDTSMIPKTKNTFESLSAEVVSRILDCLPLFEIFSLASVSRACRDHVLTYCNRIKNVDLFPCRTWSDRQLLWALSFFPVIEKLSFKKCSHFTNIAAINQFTDTCMLI